MIVDAIGVPGGPDIRRLTRSIGMLRWLPRLAEHRVRRHDSSEGLPKSQVPRVRGES